MIRTTIVTILAIALLAADAPREMVQNGDFENGMAGWSYVAEGDAHGSATLVSDNPLDQKSPHSLKLEAPQLGQRCGFANAGGAGMNVVAERWYDATFAAWGNNGKGIGLVFSLETADGKKVCARTTLPEIGRGGEIGSAIEGSDTWRRYTVSLHAYASDPKCRLVISPIEPGTLYFDNISLVPRDKASAEAKP